MSKPKVLLDTIGKWWMFKASTYHFLSVAENDKYYTIATNQKWINVTKNKLDEFIDQLLPADSDLPVVGSKVQIKVLENNTTSLVDLLKQNIKNVEADPSYVSQASEVTKSVKAIIDLAKLEFQVKKSFQ